jgi:hypothetical protein
VSAYSVTGRGGCSDGALYGWSSRSMALAAAGCWSPPRPDSCAFRSARRTMSSSARSMRRRRLTAHRPRRRRRMAGQCGQQVRGVPRRREARRGPGAARWTAGSAAAGGRMQVGVATRLPRQERNRPRGELMTSRECETAIRYPWARRSTGCGDAGRGGARLAAAQHGQEAAGQQARGQPDPACLPNHAWTVLRP